MKKLIATLVLALIATPALAARTYDMPSKSSSSGKASKGYIGIAAGKNTIAADATTTWAASTATSVFGGYSFNDNVAAEVAYTSLGTADTDPASTISATGTLMSLSAVGTMPLGQAFSLFAKVGYGQSKIEVAANSFSETYSGVVYGAGAIINMGPHVGIRLAYDKFKVGSTTPTDSSMVSLGALFRF